MLEMKAKTGSTFQGVKVFFSIVKSLKGNGIRRANDVQSHESDWIRSSDTGLGISFQ